MKSMHLNTMTKGWFVGAFQPSALWNDACEVAVKHYVAGDKEERHFHKIATEITVVISGKIQMFGKTWDAGDIIIAEPGDATDFLSISDSVNVVVKTPSVLGDKYLSPPSDD